MQRKEYTPEGLLKVSERRANDLYNSYIRQNQQGSLGDHVQNIMAQMRKEDHGFYIKSAIKLISRNAQWIYDQIPQRRVDAQIIELTYQACTITGLYELLQPPNTHVIPCVTQETFEKTFEQEEEILPLIVRLEERNPSIFKFGGTLLKKICEEPVIIIGGLAILASGYELFRRQATYQQDQQFMSD